MSFVYLASPYTPTGTETIEDRVNAAYKAAAQLMLEGYTVFSPVAHSHHIADHMDESLRLDHEFWMKQSLDLVSHCNKVIVLKLEGWERSRGIAAEVKKAIGLCIPVEYRDPSPSETASGDK